MASAGRVLLISKGAWVSGTSYDPMDFVYYGGNSYVCKASVSGSTVPSSDTTHWQLMASGFDATLITQTITNDADKIASDAAVYTECQKLESNFAVIQASNVATQAFAIGDYLTYQGELYKVTSAIANGGTITPGTNCTKTSVGTQLDALNDSLRLESGSFTRVLTSGGTSVSEASYTCSYYLTGNLVTAVYMFWNMIIANPNSNAFKLALPFKCKQARGYGLLGYQNFGSANANTHCSVTNLEDNLYFQVPVGTGEKLITGSDLSSQSPGYTWQCAITYFTDRTPVSGTSPTPDS